VFPPGGRAGRDLVRWKCLPTRADRPAAPLAHARAAAMPRKLKYHEQKLLKKVDFLNWKADGNQREVKILRRYHIQDREDYHTYNKIVGMITSLTTHLKKMDPRDPVRIELTDNLLDKLHGLGLIQHKKLLACDQIAASTLCRRRLPVVLCRLKFAETLKEAATIVEQGHIRVGPETVTDPAYIVTRQMEDYLTWVDTSKIKRHVMKYNDKLDDYDLL
jgi:U3 small nucleolar ribonucleoprotein protein IMP3